MLEVINKGDIREIKNYLREVIKTTASKEFFSLLEYAFKNIRFGKKTDLCGALSELGGILELWDDRIEVIASLLSEYCGRSYLADFKVWLKHGTFLRKRICDTSFLEIAGRDLIRVFEHLLNADLKLDEKLFKTLEKYLGDNERYQLVKTVEILSEQFMNIRKSIINSAELLRLCLEKQVLLYRKDFAKVFVESFERIHEDIGFEKSVIISYILSYITKLDLASFKKVLKVLFSWPNSFKGSCLGFTIALYRHILNIKHPDITPAYSSFLNILSEIVHSDASEFISVFESLRDQKFEEIEGIIAAEMVDFLYDELDEHQRINVLEGLNYYINKAPERVLMALSRIIKKGVDKKQLLVIFDGIAYKLRTENIRVRNRLITLIRDIILYISPQVAANFLAGESAIKFILGIFAKCNDALLITELSRFIKMFSMSRLLPKGLKSSDLKNIIDRDTFNRAIENLEAALGDNETKLLIGMLGIEGML